MLDVELIRTLRAVDELGSVRLAAADLAITQSAVSARLRRLGELTGQPVTSPDGRGIAVTRHGRFVLHATGELIDAHDAAVVRLVGAPKHTTLRILANEVFFSTQVLGLAATLRRRLPTIAIEWTVDAAAHAGATRHAPDTYDIAVHQVLEQEVREDDIVVWRQNLVWVQSDEHRFDPADPLPVITFGAECFYRDLIERTLDDAGRDFTIAVSCPSLAGVIDTVRAGIGVAVLDGNNMSTGLRPFSDASAFAPLPDVAQICRLQPHAPDIAREVAACIAAASGSAVLAKGRG